MQVVKYFATFAVMLLLLSLPVDGVEDLIQIAGMTLMKFSGYMVVGFSLLRLIGGERIKLLPDFHIAVLLAIVWIILSYTWTEMPAPYGDGEDDPRVLKVNLYILVLVLLIFQFADTVRDMEKLYVPLVLGAFWLIYYMLRDYHVTTNMIRYEIKGVDGNEAGVRLAMMMPMAIFLLIYSRFLLWRLLGLVYLPIAMYTILITGSRTGSICMVIGCAGLVTLLKYTDVIGRVIGVIIAILVFAITISAIPQKTLERVLSTGHEVSSGTLNSRTDIWRNAYDEWKTSPVYGHGLDSFKRILNKHNVSYIGHNSYITLSVEQGLVGVLLYLSMIVIAFIYVWQSPQNFTDKILLYSVLLITVVGQMSLDLQDRLYIWLAFALVTLHAYTTNFVEVETIIARSAVNANSA